MNSEEIEFLNSIGLTYECSIAKGGFGAIYRVYSKFYNMSFALKKIDERQFNEEEVNCHKTIDNPHVVNLYSYHKFKGNVYLLMEFCPSDLESIVKNEQIKTKSELMEYVYGCIVCVKAVHDRNISHRDIKPSNFLVDSYGRIKITDFGLATIHDNTSLTCSAKGTKLYMAPELFTHKEFDAKCADIWSLGITIYHLATGSYPFYASTTEGLIEKILMGVYSLENIYDMNLRQIIVNCLRIRPELRATIDDLIKSPYFQINSKINTCQSVLSASKIKRLSQQYITKPNLTGSNKFSIVSLYGSQRKVINKSRSRGPSLFSKPSCTNLLSE